MHWKIAWPAELEAKAKKLYEEGLPTSKIGLLIGKTRNAIIGISNRRGWNKSKNKWAKPRERKVKVRVSSYERVRIRKLDFHTKPKAPRLRFPQPSTQYRTPQSDLEIPMEQRRTLMTLDDCECHWPVGDPQSPSFFFCGAPTGEGMTYCPAHHARAVRQYEDLSVNA